MKNTAKVVLVFLLLSILSISYTLYSPVFAGDASPDTVNGWYFVGASGPIDTAYSRIVSDTSTEGTKSQGFTWNSTKGIHVRWEKKLNVIYKTPTSFAINYYLNKLEPINHIVEGAEFQLFFGNEDTLHPLSSAANDNYQMHTWFTTYKDSDRYPNPPMYFNRIQIEVNSSTLRSEWIFDNLYLIYDKKEPIDSVLVLDRFGDPEPAPIFGVSPSEINFGNVGVGESADQNITVTNTGDADLIISGAVSNNIEFTISPTSATIPSQSNAVFSVTFAPTDTGSENGNIIFAHNAENSLDTVTVSGRGIHINSPPSKFHLLFPSNGDTVDSLIVQFVWQKSKDIDSDKLFYTLYINGADTLHGITDTTFVLFNGDSILKYESTYNWYVVAEDDSGATTKSWETFSFNTPKATSINEREKKPRTFTLNQNYPNPFNPTTTIRYQIPYRTNIKLEIYNMIGQKIAIFVDDEKNAGYYEIKWNAEKFSSGIYFYILRARNLTEKKKMVLMK